MLHDGSGVAQDIPRACSKTEPRASRISSELHIRLHFVRRIWQLRSRIWSQSLIDPSGAFERSDSQLKTSYRLTVSKSFGTWGGASESGNVCHRACGGAPIAALRVRLGSFRQSAGRNTGALSK